MVNLPSFKRSQKQSALADEKPGAKDGLDYDGTSLSRSQVKRATRARMAWCMITAACLFIAVIFLIVVEIGNTSDRTALRDIWFIRLDLSDVIPITVPDAALLNTIARTLGLHDFYQVGLWNYCEGYNGQGVTQCSPNMSLYWFNPVEIITSELLAGARIQLPDEISSILNIIQIASHWMFALFLTGACLSFVLMPLVLFSIKSRWIAFVLMIFSALNAIFIIAASVIGTVMFIIMRNVFESNAQTNIQAEVGTTMFALMWVASAFALFAFLIQLSLSCCCASRRDVRRGKKRGSRKAYQIS